METFDIKFVIFRQELVFYDFSKISQHKIPEIKISVKIIKLTNQMISKSSNSHMNRNLLIRGLQRNQNYQIYLVY